MPKKNFGIIFIFILIFNKYVIIFYTGDIICKSFLYNLI